MKLLMIFLLGIIWPAFAVNAPKKSAPQYNAAAESVYKSMVEDVRDRQCPVSGGVGSDGSMIEVHLATAEFTRMMEINVHKGEEIEVTGWKLEFEGVQTIFAREVKHGNETYVFRAKDGTPAWMY